MMPRLTSYKLVQQQLVTNNPTTAFGYFRKADNLCFPP